MIQSVNGTWLGIRWFELTGTFANNKGPDKVQLKLVLPNCCEMTGRSSRVHPIPEVPHVMNNISTLHLRKKPVVGTDDNSILLLCKVKNPFGEPSRKQT